MNSEPLAGRQSGLTYVEVLIAATLVSIALVPALEALLTGMSAARIFQSSSDEHYALLARMEEVLAEPHSALAASAAAAGNPDTPCSYSDVTGSPNRRLVYLALYDADDADGDNDVFTVMDPDMDGDGNPYTDYRGPLWIRVEVESSATSFDSLTAP